MANGSNRIPPFQWQTALPVRIRANPPKSQQPEVPTNSHGGPDTTLLRELTLTAVFPDLLCAGIEGRPFL